MAQAGGLYYEEHGYRSGAPLILSPGLGGSASYWKPNIAGLANEYWVVPYDHRGTGRSERAIEGMLTVERMADDLLILIDALGVEKATIVGHAAGGLAALALALRAPERLESIVVINGWSKLDPHTARVFDTRLAILGHSGVRPFIHAQPIFLYPSQWASDRHEHLMAEEEEQVANFPGVEMMQRRIAAIRTFNIRDRLTSIRVPTLFVVSSDDMLVPPSCSEYMAGHVPGAALAWLEGGHACNVTQPGHFDIGLKNWLGKREK